MEQKTILLVEDSRDDEELTIRALRKGKIHNEIVVARDGEEAVTLLHGGNGKQAMSRLPQLVLLDLKLPKLDGIEVLKRIRTEPRTKTLPVVILTSSREERDLGDAYNFGVNSYICKPVDMEQFTEAVRQLELYWLVLNETLVR